MGQQKEARLRSLVIEPRKMSAFMLTATNHDKYSIGCTYIFLVLIYTDRSKHTIKKERPGCELQNGGIYRFAEGGGRMTGYTVKGGDEGYPRPPTTSG